MKTQTISYFYSPFPREKSNKEVLRYSKAQKIPNTNKAILDIPPSVTMSYMLKNPYYFDLQKHIQLKGNKQLAKSKNNAINKSKTYTKIKKRPASSLKSYTIYDANKLNTILNTLNKKTNLKKVENYKPKLEPGCEKIEQRKKKNNNIKLSNKDILNILNKIQIPMTYSKDFGKTPNYINEFKIRNFIEKEYERLINEEKGFPIGTFKVWDNDRIAILNNLYVIKEELIKKLNSFPVSYYLRSYGVKNARAMVEKRLNEIDYAIKLFELTQVFLKY